VYKNVTRGLFEKDKILFSFMIAISIGREAKIISEEMWSLFSKGPTPNEKDKKIPNPNNKLLSDSSWEYVQYLENNFAKFTGLV
jgi:dynein heavy chain